jgi:hypothetical protein
MTKHKAQSIVEYGLIVVFVAAISVVILNKYGGSITKVGTRANSTVSSASTSMKDYCNSLTDTDATAECIENIK